MSRKYSEATVKCDRCGNEVTTRERIMGPIISPGNWCRAIIFSPEESKGLDESIDLCPPCAKDFKAWVVNP